MAIYHLNTQPISRASGGSAVAAAAYRSRSEIEDRRTGKKHDYRNANRDLLFEGIYAPKGSPEWTKDRAQLWNFVQEQESRVNSRLARDFNIALPHELSIEQNRWLLQDFVRENFTRRGLVADVAIHAPHEYGDDRNIHAHILVTTRAFENGGWAPNKDRTLDKKETLQQWRESWENLANRHLERHGFEPTLDHRSFKERGLDRMPTVHMGKTASALERDGMETALGSLNRAIDDANRQFREIETPANENVIAENVTVLEVHPPPQFDPAYAREETRPGPTHAKRQDAQGRVVPETTREATQRPSYEAENTPKPPPTFHRATAREETGRTAEQPAQTRHRPPQFSTAHAREYTSPAAPANDRQQEQKSIPPPSFHRRTAREYTRPANDDNWKRAERTDDAEQERQTRQQQERAGAAQQEAERIKRPDSLTPEQRRTAQRADNRLAREDAAEIRQELNRTRDDEPFIERTREREPERRPASAEDNRGGRVGRPDTKNAAAASRTVGRLFDGIAEAAARVLNGIADSFASIFEAPPERQYHEPRPPRPPRTERPRPEPEVRPKPEPDRKSRTEALLDELARREENERSAAERLRETLDRQRDRERGPDF